MRTRHSMNLSSPNGDLGIWNLDFGFWIGSDKDVRSFGAFAGAGNPKSKTQNPKSGSPGGLYGDALKGELRREGGGVNFGGGTGRSGLLGGGSAACVRPPT